MKQLSITHSLQNSFGKFVFQNSNAGKSWNKEVQNASDERQSERNEFYQSFLKDTTALTEDVAKTLDFIETKIGNSGGISYALKNAGLATEQWKFVLKKLQTTGINIDKVAKTDTIAISNGVFTLTRGGTKTTVKLFQNGTGLLDGPVIGSNSNLNKSDSGNTGNLLEQVTEEAISLNPLKPIQNVLGVQDPVSHTGNGLPNSTSNGGNSNNETGNTNAENTDGTIRIDISTGENGGKSFNVEAISDSPSNLSFTGDVNSLKRENLVTLFQKLVGNDKITNKEFVVTRSDFYKKLVGQTAGSLGINSVVFGDNVNKKIVTVDGKQYAFYGTDELAQNGKFKASGYSVVENSTPISLDFKNNSDTEFTKVYLYEVAVGKDLVNIIKAARNKGGLDENVKAAYNTILNFENGDKDPKTTETFLEALQDSDPKGNDLVINYLESALPKKLKAEMESDISGSITIGAESITYENIDLSKPGHLEALQKASSNFLEGYTNARDRLRYYNEGITNIGFDNLQVVDISPDKYEKVRIAAENFKLAQLLGETNIDKEKVKEILETELTYSQITDKKIINKDYLTVRVGEGKNTEEIPVLFDLENTNDITAALGLLGELDLNKASFSEWYANKDKSPISRQPYNVVKAAAQKHISITEYQGALTERAKVMDDSLKNRKDQWNFNKSKLKAFMSDAKALTQTANDWDVDTEAKNHLGKTLESLGKEIYTKESGKGALTDAFNNGLPDEFKSLTIKGDNYKKSDTGKAKEGVQVIATSG